MNTYQAGYELLNIFVEFEGILTKNYEKGNDCQMALATLSLQQGDLFSSFVVLLSPDEQGPLIGRAIVLRTILENFGAILHTKNNTRRSRRYLDYVRIIDKQAKDQIHGIKPEDSYKQWSRSDITSRVRQIDEYTGRFYGTLSNFVHGNNTLYYYNSKEFTTAFVKVVNSCFISVFSRSLREMATSLDMDDTKRLVIIKRVNTVSDLYKH